MKVIGTGGTERGRILLTQQGAHHVLDHHAPNYLDQIPALTDGHGVDIILEMLANINLDKDLKFLAMGGRVVVIGSRGRIEIDPRDTMMRDASILGMLLFNVSPREASIIYAALGAGLENGTLHPVIGKEMPLAEAPRAHRNNGTRRLRQNNPCPLKLFLRWGMRKAVAEETGVIRSTSSFWSLQGG